MFGTWFQRENIVFVFGGILFFLFGFNKNGWKLFFLGGKVYEIFRVNLENLDYHKNIMKGNLLGLFSFITL